MEKPYRRQSPREPQGIPVDYKDLSKTQAITEEQVETVLGGTTIVNSIVSSVPDATTTLKGKVELATDGESAAGVVVQGNDSRLLHYSAVQFILDGGTNPLTAGMTVDLYCPFGFTILRAVVLADQSGAAQFDVRKDTYTNYPPTGGDSIVASAPPALVAAIKSKDSTLTGWTTAIAADTTIQAYLTSVDGTITRLTLTLYIRTT